MNTQFLKGRHTTACVGRRTGGCSSCYFLSLICTTILPCPCRWPLPTVDASTITHETSALLQPLSTMESYMAWPRVARGGPTVPNKNEADARFSFPDRRHSSYSEVCPGVSAPSRLISCLSSIPIFRSASRGVPLFVCLSSRRIDLP